MATTVKMGSKGSEVSQLQEMLNQQGYNLSVDGIFGSATQAAVRQYQQSSGLTVDGIAGANTWGSLTGRSGGSGSGTFADDSAGSGSYTTYPSGMSGSVGGSGIVNAGYSFQQLLAELDRSPYTALTESEILSQARSSYDPIYNAEVEGLTQGAEQYYLALEQQLAGLGTSYDRQRGDTAKAYATAESEAANNMLKRGMGRSSYGSQITANIATEGAQAQADINAAQTEQESNLLEQKTLYGKQLSQSLTRLSADYETNITNYANELRNQEREREIAAKQYGNQLALSLYDAATSQAQWEAQFAESQRQFNEQLAQNQQQFDAQMAAASASSGGGGGSGGGSNKGSNTGGGTGSSGLTDFLDTLSGYDPSNILKSNIVDIAGQMLDAPKVVKQKVGGSKSNGGGSGGGQNMVKS